METVLLVWGVAVSYTHLCKTEVHRYSCLPSSILQCRMFQSRHFDPQTIQQTNLDYFICTHARSDMTRYRYEVMNIMFNKYREYVPTRVERDT